MQSKDDDPPTPAAPPRSLWQAPRAETWERREGLRATFLLHLPTARERAAYRRLGQILYDAALSRGEEGSEAPAQFAFRQVAAVLSELRFLQGFLLDVAELQAEDEEAVIARLGRQARTLARVLARLADGEEQKLSAEAQRL